METQASKAKMALQDHQAHQVKMVVKEILAHRVLEDCPVHKV